MISIVVPAFNEAKEIGKCLSSLLNQNTSELLEIIVVNNGSSDSTEQVVREFSSSMPIRLMDEPVKSRGAARAAGFKAAKGDIILSTDADAICPNNWAGELARAIREKDAVAVCGTAKITDNHPFANWIFNKLQPLTSRFVRILFGHHWLCGFSFAVTAEAYKKSGGIRPELNAMEDVELSLRISRIGKIVFLPYIPVVFSGRRFKSGFVNGMLSYVKPFTLCWLRRKRIDLSDIR